jgi:hypothetical protein
VKFFRFTRLMAVIVASATYAAGASAQARVASSELRTKTLVASFNKSKHVLKEKHGVTKEKYIDVRSVPAVKQNPADYSGTYDADFGFSLSLRADRGGAVEGTGSEVLSDDAGVWRTFTLKNGRVTGALITATKVYGNGATEPFEGVFINRSVFESPTDPGVTTFGLGVVGKELQVGGQSVGRLFYQLR